MEEGGEFDDSDEDISDEGASNSDNTFGPGLLLVVTLRTLDLSVLRG